MPYSLPYTEVNGTLADATQVQSNFAALLTAVNNALARDGSVPAIGAIPMGGYKITGVGTPTSPADAATMGWVQGLGYAPLASPTLTGVPTAPTAAGGTNTTQLATTAYVTSAIANFAPLASPALTGTPTVNGSPVGYLDLVGSSPGGAYSLALTDRGQTVIVNGAVTIPANASVAFPVRTTILLIATAATTVSITTDTLTLAGTSSTGTRNLAINSMAALVKVGATSWIISGPGVS